MSVNIVNVRNVEIPLPMDVSDEQIERAITLAIADCGLRVTLLGTLGKYPGCVHWHLKRGNETGTLEITFWKQKRRAWFTIQSGRIGDWIEEQMGIMLKNVQIYIRR